MGFSVTFSHFLLGQVPYDFRPDADGELREARLPLDPRDQGYDDPADAFAAALEHFQGLAASAEREETERLDYIASTPEDERWRHYEWACESLFRQEDFAAGQEWDDSDVLAPHLASLFGRYSERPRPSLRDFGLTRPAPEPVEPAPPAPLALDYDDIPF